MQVRVLCFGVSKDWLGAASTVELPEGASVADLLECLREKLPARIAGPLQEDALRGIAVSVNAEYATAGQVLREGDEVGLLPPVSGGTSRTGASRSAKTLDENVPEQTVLIALTRDPIDAEKLVAGAKRGEDGAVVVFDGIVRNNTRGRKTLHLDYEAYEEMALKQMKELAGQARKNLACGRLRSFTGWGGWKWARPVC